LFAPIGFLLLPADFVTPEVPGLVAGVVRAARRPHLGLRRASRDAGETEGARGPRAAAPAGHMNPA